MPNGVLFYWKNILNKLMNFDCSKTAQFALENMLLGSPYQRDYSIDILLNCQNICPVLVMKEFEKIIKEKKITIHFMYPGIFEKLLISFQFDTFVEFLKQNPEIIPIMTLHIPIPYVQNEQPILHELTEFILKNYGENEKVFKAFLSRTGTLSYSGKISQLYLNKLDVVRFFENHEIPAIRKWARLIKDESKPLAKAWKDKEEEDTIT